MFRTSWFVIVRVSTKAEQRRQKSGEKSHKTLKKFWPAGNVEERLQVGPRFGRGSNMLASLAGSFVNQMD